jgi:K+ transporter
MANTDIHTTITDQHGHPHTATPRGRYLFTLSLAALGVVYGDIGTRRFMRCANAFTVRTRLP